MPELKAVVLMSGGLDSTTVAAHALAAGYEVRGLSVLYGQTHAREVESARGVSARLGIPLVEADASFYGGLASYSALTGEGFAIPASRSLDSMSVDIPLTYVPMRNTFFVTLAAAVLESWMLALIETGGVEPRSLEPAIFVGANAIDYSGYPDCRPEFYASLVEVLRQGSKLGTQYGVQMTVEAPIIAMGKAEIAAYGTKLGAPLDLTWSCYTGGARTCGTCDSCLLRAAGFAEAGLVDPAVPR